MNKRFLTRCFYASVIAVLFFITPVFSQAVADPNKGKLVEAIKLMDKGELDASITMLKDLQKLDPDNYMYNYELGYALYLKKDYATAIEVMEKLKASKEANDLLFQLQGNAYDMSGNAEKAGQTYADGLLRFPNSGKLYLESGIMNLKKNDLKAALGNFEKGIAVEPKFPSTYYWASRVWLETPEKLWGLMYGEIFMNLESNSKRTAEISKMLFDTYKSQISITSPGHISVSFSKNNVVTTNNINADKLMPYGVFVYERILMVSALGYKELNINTLDSIRTNFVGEYFKGKTAVTYPNVLFSYQKKIVEAGHMECYNHWILHKGDEGLFKSWLAANTEKWQAFLKWYNTNRLVLDANNRFSISDYL
ncbi:tetratricopeptide repeat protein [Pedobacter psychroterrae]|uniref:Tetratricopeptide repeat protein n=1 Tax=Pedobacter psychroterrae TaxID=2530453 RepID=A0A4V2ML02_9SPHI|nr:tetratricopeptide repeat protein [Pedobacter psychroterrae]TCD00197.1 tetratricopeptide repeat protein [Pedobacter psychroterrae]